MSIAAAHLELAARCGDQPAISLDDEVVLDHRGLAEQAARLAAALIDAGLEPGDRVALLLGNCVEFYPLLLGIWSAGLSAVPIVPLLPPAELAWILRHSGAKLCAIEGPLRAPVEAALRELADDGEARDRLRFVAREQLDSLTASVPLDAPREHPEGEDGAAWLFYTSGTTGRPKGVVLSHRNLAALTQGYLDEVDTPGPGHSIIHLTPLTHGSGMAGLPHLLRGANQVMPGARGLPKLDGVLELIERWPDAVLVLPPVIVDMLARRAAAEPARVSSLRAVLYGSAPMFPEAAARALEVFGPKLVQLYGLGEAPMSVMLGRAEHRELLGAGREGPLPVGRPRAGIELRVVDEHGAQLPPETVGEILLRGASVTRGYLDDPEASAAALREGWLHTGDLGWRDAEGNLYVIGRARDTIHTAAGPVYPQTVELRLLAHPSVHEVAVVGQPTEDGHTRAIAFVRLEAGCAHADGHTLDEHALAAHCETLAAKDRPTSFVRVDALPRNGSGKVLKRVLRARLLTSTPAARR